MDMNLNTPTYDGMVIAAFGFARQLCDELGIDYSNQQNVMQRPKVVIFGDQMDSMVMLQEGLYGTSFSVSSYKPGESGDIERQSKVSIELIK